MTIRFDWDDDRQKYRGYTVDEIVDALWTKYPANVVGTRPLDWLNDVNESVLGFDVSIVKLTNEWWLEIVLDEETKLSFYPRRTDKGWEYDDEIY